MNPAARSVDAFLQALAARLPGPAKLRAEILAELQDGLLQAVDDNQAAGAETDKAVQLALAQFGDGATLARSFWPELAAARARRIVLALFATAPIVAALWLAAARSRGIARTGGLFDSTSAHALAAVLIAAAVCAGIGTIAATGLATRWIHPRPGAPLLGAATVAGVTIVADLGLLSMLSWRLASFPGTVHRMALGAAILASGTRLVLASRAGRSCLAITGRRPLQRIPLS
jgi:hypothetical protein